MPKKTIATTTTEKKKSVKAASKKEVKESLPVKKEPKKEVKKESKKINKDELKVPKVSYYGTGKRKTSIARVWLFEGSGNININSHNAKDYLKRDIIVNYIKTPLNKLNITKKYDVVAGVTGGGLIGQAGAIRLGIARALVNMNAEFKKLLKEDENNLLTRDSRIKERKKYGRKRARKGYQFRKR
jgi:small subunit ribosomal protein S9